MAPSEYGNRNYADRNKLSKAMHSEENHFAIQNTKFVLAI